MSNNGKKWGIMVYMAADNNLSQDAIQGIGGILESFKQNKSSLENTEFFLYFDGNAFGFPSLQFDFSEPISPANPIRFNREFRSSPESIFRFVEKCAEKSGFEEIENYALIVSSHGFGFQEDSLLQDDSSKTSATVQNLADNIRKLNDEVLHGRLKILGFDSCVMNMLEVAEELCKELQTGSGKDLKEVFLVSSEGYVPNAGWNYSRFIEGLTSMASPTSRGMAQLLVDSYIDEYEPSYEYSGLSIDITAFSLGLVDELSRNVNALGKCLLDLLKTEGTRRRVENIILDSHSKSQTYLYDQSVDIKDFCDLLMRELIDDKVIDEKTELYGILANISELFVSDTIYCRKLGAENQFSNGMSLYFPWSYHTFLIILPRYRKLKFGMQQSDENSLSDWGEFLYCYLSATMRVDAGYRSGTALFALALENGLKELPEDHKCREILTIAIKHIMSAEFLDSQGSKINPPDNSRINPPDKTRLGGAFLENFRRTRNFPWLPKPALTRLTANLNEDGKIVANGVRKKVKVTENILN